MTRSIRSRLTLSSILLVLAALLAAGLANYLLLGEVYTRSKIRSIEQAYETIDASYETESSDAFSAMVQQLGSMQNLQCVITGPDFSALYATSSDPSEMESRLFGYYTGLYHDQVEDVREGKSYTVQKTIGQDGLQYLELWGSLTSGNYIFLRTQLDSIRNTVGLTIRLFTAVGIAVIFLSALLSRVFAKRLTDPLMRLTEISRRMAQLDFEAHYEEGSAGAEEIDVLGHDMNVLSNELASTISELKGANAQLEKDIRQREKLDEMRVEFLNNVSHELKTPISLIRGYAEGLGEGIADDPESRAYYTDVIIDEAEKMDRLVRELLTLNKLEFGNEELSFSRFDLTEVVRGVLMNMDLMISSADAHVFFDCSTPVYVWGDPFKIEEVITNYMSNALHHIGGERKIEIRTMRDIEGKVTLSVFNTGSPIPEKDLPHIWEKFYKVDKARTREYGGTGIGLSIVKAIMDAHHGQCGVRNFENGVAFYITLEGRK